MDIRKVIHIGSSIGLTLPKHLLTSRNIVAGDELKITETNKGILIQPHSTEANRSEKITALALGFVNRYREDIEALADK